jgi:four helix bundle protein
MSANEIFEEPTGAYNKQKDFTSLHCWQDARRMKLFFYTSIVPKLPIAEKNNLINQIKRAAVSATANIAEGYGRFHYQEGIQFYRIARGSIYELKDHLISCFDLNYIDSALLDEGMDLIESSKIKLNGYINYAKNLKQNQKQ